MHVKRFARQQGFTLIEALIGIVVLGLGVLALLVAQLHTLGNTQNSIRRTQAVRLIDDLSERLKAMPDAVAAAPLFATNWNAASSTTGVVDCSVVDCTSAQLAQFEKLRWLRSVQHSLPLGQANVFVVADMPQQLGVMLAWRANEKDGDAAELIVPPSTGDAAVSCPAGRICHLQYISLAQRCQSIGADQALCGGA